MRSSSILLLGAVFCVDSATLPPFNFGSSCAHSNTDNQHVQNKYCRADFALKTMLKSTGTERLPSQPDWRPVEISIKNQIKISTEFMELAEESLKSLWVYPSSQLKDLKIGQKYLITGKLLTVDGKKRLVVDLCKEWTQLWSAIGHRHKASLRKSNFERGCACTIDLTVSTAQKNSAASCSINSTKSMGILDQHKLSLCYRDHAHCVRVPENKGKRRCKWNQSAEFRTCLAQLR